MFVSPQTMRDLVFLACMGERHGSSIVPPPPDGTVQGVLHCARRTTGCAALSTLAVKLCVCGNTIALVLFGALQSVAASSLGNEIQTTGKLGAICHPLMSCALSGRHGTCLPRFLHLLSSSELSLRGRRQEFCAAHRLASATTAQCRTALRECDISDVTLHGAAKEVPRLLEAALKGCV